MGPLPILSIIHTVTISTILNFNGYSNRHGLKTLRCKQTFNTMEFGGRYNLTLRVNKGLPTGLETITHSAHCKNLN